MTWHPLLVSSVLMTATMSDLFFSWDKKSSFLPENCFCCETNNRVQVFSSSLMRVVFYGGTFTIASSRERSMERSSGTEGQDQWFDQSNLHSRAQTTRIRDEEYTCTLLLVSQQKQRFQAERRTSCLVKKTSQTWLLSSADVVCCWAGTLHVGDEIREINGNSVVGQTVETLQRTLVSTWSDLFIHLLLPYSPADATATYYLLLQ